MKSEPAGVFRPALPERPSLRMIPPEGASAKDRTAGSPRSSPLPFAREGATPRSLRATPPTNAKPRDVRRPRGREGVPSRKESGLEHAPVSQGVRTYVLDTNVLLHNPKSLFVFQENNVVIPFTVLEELDTFKGVNSEIGRNARECIRYLDRLRELGDLTEGVKLGEAAGDGAATGPVPTGSLRVVIADEEMPEALLQDTADHRIISVAWNLQRQGERAVFVSKDINARIKADALGIHAEDFENQKINVDELYTGYLSLRCDGGLIDELYSERMLPLEKLREAADDAAAASGANEPHVPGVTDAVEKEPMSGAAGGSAGAGEPTGKGLNGAAAPAPLLHPNQYVVLIDSAEEGHTGLARRLGETEHVIPVTQPRKPTFGIMARNVQQTMALDLLLDDEVKLVTLIGSAGTGKTLLAVAAGMAKVFTDSRYEKLLVARPIMPMGRDIGYLPGDKDEKLTAWMQPIFDNLAYLLSTRGAPNQNAESHTTEQRVQKLIADGRLVLEPLTYIRGRSIPHQFIIIDEAQNLSPHEVKTIVSRVGEGTKIVFTGDIEQIDHPYLDASSNGLTYAVERMKGVGVVGHVTLAKSERSSLASVATERL